MKLTLEDFNALNPGTLPGLLGIEFTAIHEKGLESRLAVRPDLLAPNGFLHAATVIALSDTTCGYGCRMFLPDGANFTTIELKTNFVGTVREGAITCTATAQHAGRSTQVWDATVFNAQTEKPIAYFRCTQMVLRG
jgi:uncharacterized protein (TIGR00369 family)